jgi:glycosyltransferase involved in cell wall biosynthesis
MKPILMIAYTNYRTDPRVIREAEAAVSAGFEVDFIGLRRDNDPKEEVVRGVRVIHLNQSRYRGDSPFRYVVSYLEFLVRCSFKTAWMSFKKRYRVVHVNNMPDFVVFCALVPKLMGAKVLLDIHDPMPETFASKFKQGEGRFFFKLLLREERLSAGFADRVLTVHDPVKNHILVKHGLAPESIQVIGNFPDDRLFKLRPDIPNKGKVRMAFHGTILERYGLGDAMTALSRMHKRDNISLKIIGEGDFSERLKAMISSLGLDDIVHFDNRFYPVDEIPQRLADCNLGFAPLEISAITNYCLPVKLLEYVSLGMPSITVRNVAITHYFSEEDCLFYQPNDVESLRAVLDRVAENPDLLEAYRRRILALREGLLWSKEAEKYAALLRGLS